MTTINKLYNVGTKTHNDLQLDNSSGPHSIFGFCVYLPNKLMEGEAIPFPYGRLILVDDNESRKYESRVFTVPNYDPKDDFGLVLQEPQVSEVEFFRYQERVLIGRIELRFGLTSKYDSLTRQQKTQFKYFIESWVSYTTNCEINDALKNLNYEIIT